MIQKPEQSYDYIGFSELAYEFDFSDPNDIENKIKRRLKYYNLASYDQKRIDYIIQLKNELYAEISLQSKSKYFNKSSSNYADLADFNIDKMNADFLENYDKLTDSDLKQILNFAIYLYYMR